MLSCTYEGLLQQLVPCDGIKRSTSKCQFIKAVDVLKYSNPDYSIWQLAMNQIKLFIYYSIATVPYTTL